MPTPLATPISNPAESPISTPAPAPSVLTPTNTPKPTASPEPKCKENFIVENGECICDRKNFILRGGNCYPICGTEAASFGNMCVCPVGSGVTGKCICNEGFIEKDGKCICDERESDLIGDKCLPKPGKHEERIINGDNVKYSCKPGYDYDINRFCQKKKDRTINKKPSFWQRLFAKKPEQCYDNKGKYWFNRYKNGTAICRGRDGFWYCPDESCKEINKRNNK